MIFRLLESRKEEGRMSFMFDIFWFSRLLLRCVKMFFDFIEYSSREPEM